MKNRASRGGWDLREKQENKDKSREIIKGRKNVKLI